MICPDEFDRLLIDPPSDAEWACEEKINSFTQAQLMIQIYGCRLSRSRGRSIFLFELQKTELDSFGKECGGENAKASVLLRLKGLEDCFPRRKPNKLDSGIKPEKTIVKNGIQLIDTLRVKQNYWAGSKAGYGGRHRHGGSGDLVNRFLLRVP
jgi:hypothetical protein